MRTLCPDIVWFRGGSRTCSKFQIRGGEFCKATTQDSGGKLDRVDLDNISTLCYSKASSWCRSRNSNPVFLTNNTETSLTCRTLFEEQKKDKLIVEIHNQLLYHITWRNCWFINQWCGSSKKIQNIILFGSLSNFRRLGGQYIKFDSFCLYWSCCPSTGHVAWPVKGETVALTIWIE